jgi:transposase
MGRPSRVVTTNNDTQKRLLEMANSRSAAAGEVQRAKIVLGCLSGELIQSIAIRLSISTSTVIRWKNRFLEKGVPGLFDERRSGRPSKYGSDFKKAVLKKLEQEPPAGYGQWDGALLARELSTSKDAVWRLLREHRISLSRKRTWCVSTDPQFAAKAADVVGLYLSPPEMAIVLCVDEKPNIQALKRLTGYAISSDRRLVKGLESTYKRHGTLNLFAALDVVSGMIHTKATPSSDKTKKGFLTFMEDLLSELPEKLEYHVIMDNHSIHKRHEAWLLNHENVFFHYTPTSASWLNMVEIWFGILGRKSLRGKSFSSTEEMAGHIERFVKSYNRSAKPFVWRKRDIKGAQLKNNARNFCN